MAHMRNHLKTIYSSKVMCARKNGMSIHIAFHNQAKPNIPVGAGGKSGKME